MRDKPVAIYARVSSEQQAEAGTVGSQIAALEERVVADGFALPAEMQFIDEGYSGATLVRPALERLRDVAAGGGIDRLYVRAAAASRSSAGPRSAKPSMTASAPRARDGVLP